MLDCLCSSSWTPFHSTPCHCTRARLQDANVTWALSPEINVMACFTTNGSTSLTTLFPDTTGYVFTGTSLLDGKLVNTYQLVASQGEKTATYNFSVLASDNYTPVQLAFLGRDLVIGSHTDVYTFTYDSAIFGGTGNWPADVFDQPQGYECGGYPGPGDALQAQGNGLIRELVPQAGASAAPVEPANDAAFASFMAAYGKRYATEDELRVRHARFTRARRVIEATNRKSKVARKSLRLAMNHLGDATEGEMNLRRGKRADGSSFAVNAAVPQLPPVPALYTVQPPTAEELAALPASVDWRIQGAVEPVMDQGICGSCWTFGATGAVSGQYFLKYGSMVIFSKQEVVDCSWNFGVDGCGGGEDFLAYSWMMNNGGLASKDQYGPYLSQNGYCKANSAGRTAVLKGYVNVTSGSETALMTALATMGPVSISVDAAVGEPPAGHASCIMHTVPPLSRPPSRTRTSSAHTACLRSPCPPAADTFSFYSSGVLDDP